MTDTTPNEAFRPPLLERDVELATLCEMLAAELDQIGEGVYLSVDLIGVRRRALTASSSTPGGAVQLGSRPGRRAAPPAV